jgi:hypothetical protein
MSNKRILKAYERFDYNGKVVPGSLVLRDRIPKNGKWKEVQAYLCCNNNLTSNCIEFVVDTTDGTEFIFSFVSVTGAINFTIDWGDGTTHPDSGGGGFYEEIHTYPESDREYTVRVCFDNISSVIELNISGNI